MTKTRIFVSSTFFDLEQVREDIRATITAMGHEALLNEYASFPIDPSLTNVENCRTVVRSCDLFVLIVGGRRGSLDPESGKPITNIEYETAKQNGIDCFKFVQTTVMTLLPVWRKNPDADFAPSVDDPHVFRFVDEIASSQQWIFTFSKASEISEVLRNQLSVFLKNLLDQKRSGRINPLREFSEETERAQSLARDRPKFWEYLLTAELLRSKLSTLRQEYADFENGLIYAATTRVNAHTYLELMSSKMSDISRLSGIITKLIHGELTESWGPPGEPGDPHLILRAVNRVVAACRSFLEIEIEMSSLEPAPGLSRLASTLRGTTLGFINEIARTPDELETALQGTWEGIKQVQINLVFDAPPQLAAFVAELEEVKRHPEWLMD